MTEDEIKRLIAGRDECWYDLLALRDYYNELRIQAGKLGMEFENLNPKATDLIIKIGMADMRIKYGEFEITDVKISK